MRRPWWSSWRGSTWEHEFRLRHNRQAASLASCRNACAVISSARGHWIAASASIPMGRSDRNAFAKFTRPTSRRFHLASIVLTGALTTGCAFREVFKLVQDGVRWCTAESIPVRISAVVCRLNQHHISGLLDWCSEHGIEALNIHELDPSIDSSLPPATTAVADGVEGAGSHPQCARRARRKAELR